jgi:glycosyltransferase involved in cell wall biosynthesis
LLHVPRERIFPSGVAVRGSVVSALGPPPATQRSDYFLVVGGGDARKNPDCPIIAHARSSKLRERRLRLVIAGKYPENMADGLRYLHASHGGDPELLHMLGPVSDQELAEHYRNAILTICPSRAEGFSIPVVEANANGCPVIISNCPAQTELVPFAEDQFDPDDFDRVGALMERVAGNDAARADIINRQKGHWRRFEVRAVGERFWAPMIAMEKNSETHAPVAAPAVLRGAKPTIAIVGPMPPDKSGVADYTAACLESLAKRAEIHIFTETETPTPSAAYASVSKLTPLPYLSSRFDSVITVIGNSHFHIEPLRMLLDYGGPAIAHDARMINFYAILHGPEKAAALATKELGRPVDWPEVEVWLHNQRKLKTLFLSEILDAASPTIVHSRVTQRIIKDMYGKDTVHLPFSQYRELTEAECTSEARIRARKALDVRDGAFLISTFGGVSPDKAPEACLWALQQLVTWGVDAELAFVGHAGEPMAAGLRKLAADLGLTNRVRLFIDTVDEATYRAYLSAADVGVQLRTYALGGLAGGLLDCISAGLPSVANAHLAEAMESPDYVHVVPDGLSPVMMAEQFLALREKFKNGGRPLEARRAYNAGHNFETYCDRLLEQLELAQ